MSKPRLGTDPFSRSEQQTANVIDTLTATKPKKEPVKKSNPPSKHKWTRATFIVRDDLLDTIKYYAYLNKIQLKDVLNNALEEYFKNKKVKSPRA
jgi:hypothetical protein